MKNVLISLIVIVILLPIVCMAQNGNSEIPIPIKTSINTTYLGFNKTWSASDFRVNITTRLGGLTYIEEYFTVDSGGYPKPVTSKTHYNGNATNNNVSFQILRPLSHSGKTYNMIRGVVMINGKRIYEKWLKVSSGAHLTYTIGSKEDQVMITKRINENIARFEIQDRNLRSGLPITYKFTTPDLVIYEVNVTSTGNDSYVALRVKLLKDVPISTKRFPWTLYKYLDISLDTYQIKKIDLRYKVENSWIKNNNISEKDITLFRWNDTDKKWYGLKTNIINKDNNYTYYESKTVSLSLFVIAELRKSRTSNTNNTIDNVIGNKTLPMVAVYKDLETTKDIPTIENTTIKTTTKKSPGFDFILSIATILLSLYIGEGYRRRI